MVEDGEFGDDSGDRRGRHLWRRGGLHIYLPGTISSIADQDEVKGGRGQRSRFSRLCVSRSVFSVSLVLLTGMGRFFVSFGFPSEWMRMTGEIVVLS